MSEQAHTDLNKEKILFFDGVCNLCNASVDRVISGDRTGQILLAPLQGETAQKLLPEHGVDLDTIRSLVYWDRGKVYTFSNAALQVARDMKFPWAVFYILKTVPRPIRDYVYKLIARKRYIWFGKKESCRLPTPEEAARFLD